MAFARFQASVLARSAGKATWTAMNAPGAILARIKGAYGKRITPMVL
jgi:hypothetical protein